MKKYLFVIGILFVVVTCQETCPKFDEEILSWIPYQENDVVELYYQFSDSTIILPINSVEITHTTDISRGSIIGCKKCRGECSDYIYINGYNSDFHINIDLHLNKIGSQGYQICDTFFYSSEYDSNPNYSEITNYLFEGKEYDIVRIFENNYSQGTFEKLIIAKEIGIIGLIDIHGNSWVLKSNDKAKNSNKREKGNVVIKNVSSSC